MPRVSAQRGEDFAEIMDPPSSLFHQQFHLPKTSFNMSIFQLCFQKTRLEVLKPCFHAALD